MARSLHEKVEAIRADFIRSLPQRIDTITSLTDQIVSLPWDAAIAKNLMYELHNLRGFSGSHGLMIVNELSGKAENLIEILRQADTELTPLNKTELKNIITHLIKRMHFVHEDLEQRQKNEVLPKQVVISNKAPLIMIVDDDQNFCATIALQLENLGYRTKTVYKLEDIKQCLNTYKPQAIFMDIIFNGKRDAGTQMIKELRDAEEINCPIIYMSARDDINARLDAVRSGSVAFLSKAFSLGDLKNMLDFIVPVQRNSTFKVLIIDDDKNSAEYCAAILEHSNIHVCCLDKPENVFEYIMNFDPDVILLDMYMPEISGFELASIIRQHQNFESIPIVIMSGETDINKQFKMRSAGADDFILKPFKPHHLVDTVLNRIQRSRQTKRLIYTDGLTSLMIFPKVKEQILTLMESCARYDLDFTLALIDLDHFKTINDKYGHLAGDQVLREFSDFLLSRVRKSDLVTRYGGEEFAIVFPYTSAENAVRALNSLRDSFSQRPMHSGANEFLVTFSAGIASISKHQDLESLIGAADQALYKAKELGRNRIELD